MGQHGSAENNMTTASAFSILLIALSLSLGACGKHSNTDSVPSEPKTVISASQQHALDNAKHMEKTLLHDVELREQKMRDQGI